MPILVAIASALWLGILTSISPCPLATNIAAVSFLSKKINNPKLVLRSGIAYILGRIFIYTVLGIVIINSFFTIPIIANFLQQYMNKIIGPILLIVGLILIGVIKLNIAGFALNQEQQNSLASSGLKGCFMLGMAFALSFCPISAALFFGSLIPLALQSSWGIILPLFYGIGTGIPILIFAFGLSLGMISLSRRFEQARRFEKYMRKFTGIIFILVGIYFILNYNY